MGYVTMMAPCVKCRRPFTFNPHKVPSVVVNGTREPLCRGCVDAANPARIAKGLPPINILPGAYDEMDESEL